MTAPAEMRALDAREWAATIGGAELVWQCGEGPTTYRGWRGADGTRLIEGGGGNSHFEENPGVDADDWRAMWSAGEAGGPMPVVDGR